MNTSVAIIEGHLLRLATETVKELAPSSTELGLGNVTLELVSLNPSLSVSL